MAHPISRILTRRLFSTSPRTPLHKIRTSRPSASIPKTPARRSFATGEKGPNPIPGQSPFKIWPFIAITLAGSGAYALMVNQRKDMAPAIEAPKSAGQISGPHKTTPTFSPDKVTVLFVLGGPGAGKGTQCANLVRDYNFTHLSAGDLLREEQDRPGSEFGQLIKDFIKDGKIVPQEITIQLIENAIQDAISKTKDGRGKFLIDGFPRKMDQAVKFEEEVVPAKFVLFYDCPEEEMQKRLLKRGETSGRTDDNVESIKKRFKTFVETSMPVVDYFEKQGRVVRVVATKTPDEVYKETKTNMKGRLGENF